MTMNGMESKTASPLSTFTETFRVLDTDCDSNGIITSGGLMRLCQQIASDHCVALGLDLEYYDKTNTAWVLTESAVEVARPPRWSETITLVTRPQAINHAVFKRLVEIYDEEGNELAVLDGRWVMLDTAAHRILRHLPEGYVEMPFPDAIERELDLSIPRVTDSETVFEQKATYSLCDTNHHLNNTHYADIICDALPEHILDDSRVSRMTISFKKEIPYGATFTVRRKQIDESTWFVCGESVNEQGKTVQHFTSSATLAPLTTSR